MIQKTYVNGDANTLKDVLDYTELFSSIVIDSSSAAPVLKCYDAGENLLFEICADTAGGIPMIKAYASASSYKSSVSSSTCTYAYAYKGACILLFYYSSTYFFVMLSKSSDGGVCAVFSGDRSSTRETTLRNLYCVAWGDGNDFTALSNLPMISRDQNGLMVIPTYSLNNHTANSFFIPYGNLYNETEREVSLNNQNFFTNGYWVIRDDGEA